MKKLLSLVLLLIVASIQVSAQTWYPIERRNVSSDCQCGPYFLTDRMFYYGVRVNPTNVKSIPQMLLVIDDGRDVRFEFPPTQYGGGVLEISHSFHTFGEGKFFVTTFNGTFIKDAYNHEKVFPQGRGFGGKYGPDTNSYVTAEQNAINVIDIETGIVKRTVKVKENLGGNFVISMDRKKIAIQGDKSIMVVNLDSLLIKNKYKKGRADKDNLGLCFAFSPDSKKAIYFGYSAESLQVWDLETNKVESVFVKNMKGESITKYSGHIAYFRNGTFAMRYGNNIAICDAKDYKIIDQVGDGKRMIESFSAGPDGDRILVQYTDGLVEYYKQ